MVRSSSVFRLFACLVVCSCSGWFVMFRYFGGSVVRDGSRWFGSQGWLLVFRCSSSPMVRVCSMFRMFGYSAVRGDSGGFGCFGVVRGSSRTDGVEDSKVRWFNCSVVRCFDGLMFGGLMVRWFLSSMVRWFDVSMVRWFSGSMVRF